MRASLSLSCLTTSVTQPAPKLSQADHVDRALAEQRPERHFDGAGVGSGHDTDTVISRHFENFAGKVNGLFQLRLANLRTVRTADGSIGKCIERPTGRFEQGPEEKWVLFGRTPGFAAISACQSILQIVGSSLGRSVPPLEIWNRPSQSSAT